MGPCDFPPVRGHATHEFALLLVEPHVLLDVERAVLLEVARREVERVAELRARDVHVAAGVGVHGEGRQGKAGLAGGLARVSWEAR